MKLLPLLIALLLCGCATGKPAFQTVMIREGMKLKSEQLAAVGEKWSDWKLRQQVHRQLYYDRKFYLETVRRVYLAEGKQITDKQIRAYGMRFDGANDSPYMPIDNW